ncbi:hypothetical protein AJ79_06360 [Helicocarpus griseus UAMH5409]|uniref:Rhodopsin domain-containing protein n=1 Tax=Helicocarpus griseus UAMH5409 TaxID=1447875 RepID=A0A2B7XEC0_9EURO|nr:hypothetical protein AJ79_06360 [Helicocarpus griseus UAMH5409]
MASLPDLSEAELNKTQTERERAVTTACCCITGIAMVLRTLGRYCLKVKNDRQRISTSGHFLGLDDVFNALALITFYGLAASVFLAIDRGMGVHLERVLQIHGPEGLDRYNFAIYLCALFYNSTLGFVKLSVLALYRRILTGLQSNRLSIANWIIFGLVATNTIINVFVAGFQCNPVRRAWNATSVPGTCINTSAFYVGNAITGIITDTLVYLLAIPIIKPLQMETKKKIFTLATLLVGAFAVITSCVRLAFLPGLLVNPDATWAMGVPMDWSVAEPTVGIVVSSVPAITAIRHLFNPQRYGTNSGSTRSQLDGHVKLEDFRPPAGCANRTRVSGACKASESDGSTAGNDNGSEENLVHDTPGFKGISRTTEVELSYSPR